MQSDVINTKIATYSRTLESGGTKNICHQAKYLEKSLEVVEDDKADFSLLLPLKEMLSWQTILVFIDEMLEADGGGDDGVGHGDGHHQHQEYRGLEDGVAEFRCEAF